MLFWVEDEFESIKSKAIWLLSQLNRLSYPFFMLISRVIYSLSGGDTRRNRWVCQYPQQVHLVSEEKCIYASCLPFLVTWPLCWDCIIMNLWNWICLFLLVHWHLGWSQKIKGSFAECRIKINMQPSPEKPSINQSQPSPNVNLWLDSNPAMLALARFHRGLSNWLLAALGYPLRYAFNSQVSL